MKKLILFLFFISFLKLEAQRIAGSEIYYERLTPRKYKITAIVYRECDSDPLTSINTYVLAGNLSQNLPLSRVSIEKINDTCGNPCNIRNDVGNKGFEKHTFEGTLDLNQNPYNSFLNNICQVNIAIRQGGRDNSTTTHQAGLYYNEAEINICDSTVGNRSPRFSMEPKFYAALNQPLNYSPGPTDSSDLDSLSFSIEPVLTGTYTSIGYNSGFRFDLPLTPYCPPNPGVINCTAIPNAKPPRGFYFDKDHCALIFTPTNAGEKGYVRLKITEYRKINNQWVKLGSVSRDFLFEPITFRNNNLPYFSPQLKDISLCSDSYEFEVTAKDDRYIPVQTAADSTTIFYDKGYVNSKFSTGLAREQTASIVLRGEKTSQTKTYYMSFGAYDKKCNVDLITQTIKISSSDIVDYTKSYRIDTCNILYGGIQLKDTTQKNSYGFSILQPDNSVKNFNYNFAMHQNGTHRLTYMVLSPNNGCISYQYDTIKLSNAFENPKLNYKRDTSVCISTPLNFQFRPSLARAVNWAWYINDTMQSSKDSSLQDTFAYASKYKLVIFDRKGCSGESQLSFYPYNRNNYQLIANPNLTNCPGTDFKLTINSAYLKSPFKSHWEYDGKTTDTNSYYLSLRFPPAMQTRLLRVNVEDDNHCKYRDSVFLQSSESPYFKLTHDRNTCRDSLVEFKLSQLNNSKVKSIDWFTSYPNVIFYYAKDSLHLFRKIYADEIISAVLVDSLNCTHTDSIRVRAYTTPNIRVTLPYPLCNDNESTITPVLLNTGNFNYTWKINNRPDSFTSKTLAFKEKAGNGKIYLKVDDSGNCAVRDTLSYTVYVKPNVRILGDTLYTLKDTVKLKASVNFLNYFWSYNVFKQEFQKPAFTFGNFGQPGYYKVWLISTDFRGCKDYDTVTIHIEKSVGIDPPNAGLIRLYPNPVQNELIIESKDLLAYALYNLEGKKILGGTMSSSRESIDLSALNAGIYFMEIGGQRYKIVVSR